MFNSIFLKLIILLMDQNQIIFYLSTGLCIAIMIEKNEKSLIPVFNKVYIYKGTFLLHIV